MSVLLRIASELVSASTDLFEDGRYYAASALLRQLVEIEYLAWAFETRHQEGERWLRSSKAERAVVFHSKKAEECFRRPVPNRGLRVPLRARRAPRSGGDTAAARRYCGGAAPPFRSARAHWSHLGPRSGLGKGRLRQNYGLRRSHLCGESRNGSSVLRVEGCRSFGYASPSMMSDGGRSRMLSNKALRRTIGLPRFARVAARR